MRKLHKSVKDLRNMADASNFHGNDDYANMHGGTPNARTFSLTLTNKLAGADKTARIFPGLGYTSRAPVANGVLRTDTATGFASLDDTPNVFNAIGEADGKIEQLLDFVTQNPAHLLMIRMQVSNASQIGQNLIIKKENPFLIQETVRSINVSQYKSSNNFQDKIVEIPINETIDNQTIIDLKVYRGTEVQLTFFFGSIDNQAAAFAQS